MLLTVFFDVQDSLFVEFLEHRGTIISDVYWETIQSLRMSIKNKRQELLTEGVVLHHDNARPHVSRVTYAKLVKFKYEQRDYPSYSPDMSSCDFYVFGPLKKHLKEQRFNSDDEFKDAVKDETSSQQFWEHGILQLINQWDHCAQAYSVHFE